jgi:hypothetical protein
VQSPRRCDAREGGSWRRARREDGESRRDEGDDGREQRLYGSDHTDRLPQVIKPPLLVLPDKGVHAEVPPDYNWEAPRRAPLV